MSAIAAWIFARSDAFSVLMSVMPMRSATIAMAVCQSSMTARRLGVLRVPEHVVGVGHRGDVLGDLVVAPADAGRVDGVGHGVAPLAVVPGVGERGPDVGDVRDVGVVAGPDQLGRHHLGDLVIAGEVDVVGGLARPDLGQRLVGVVERRDRDLDVVGLVLLLERLDDLRADVVGVVVELERRALLGHQPVGDGRVVLGDRPRDRRAGGGDLQRRRGRARSLGRCRSRRAARGEGFQQRRAAECEPGSSGSGRHVGRWVATVAGAGALQANGPASSYRPTGKDGRGERRRADLARRLHACID